MDKKIIFGYILMISVGIVISSCGGNKPSPTDTPTSGNVTICADESFRPIIDSQLRVFHALYKYAHVKVNYLPEAACFKMLMDDSAKVIITTRNLNAAEKKYFNDIKYFPVETAIAKDAIAVVVNNENADTTITYQQLVDLVSGKTKQWKQVSASSSLGNIQIVFDHKNSSTLRYINDSILHNQPLADNIFATQTNEEVINYVMKNKSAIGFIGVNWAKDLHDSTNMSFTKKVKVVGIQPNKKIEMETDFPQPYQAYIQLGWYPLTRTMTTINRESRSGLGTGFVSFIASDRGQRIILKSGLVPATMPMRIVELKHTTIQ